MTAQQCLAHSWLQTKTMSPSAVINIPVPQMSASLPHMSPQMSSSLPQMSSSLPLMSSSLPQIGSPAGTRRALTPSSDLSLNGEPLKKSRCDDDEKDDCQTTGEVKGRESITKVVVTLSIELQQQQTSNKCLDDETADINSCKVTSDDDVQIKVAHGQHKSSVSLVVEDKTSCFCS
jgi:hypothetical protein